jgi:hypothetical protein
MNSRREYLFKWSNWHTGPAIPLSLHALAVLGLIKGVRIPAYWLQDAKQREADAADERATQDDARYGGCP